jgi:hypothetical protein
VLTYGTMLFQMIGIPFIYLTITTAIYSSSYYGRPPTEEPGFLYFSGAVLSLNPVIAMGLSETFYLRGDPLFIYTTDELVSGQEMLIMSPWLVFCLEAIALSALLIWIAIRKLRPTWY